MCTFGRPMSSPESTGTSRTMYTLYVGVICPVCDLCDISVDIGAGLSVHSTAPVGRNVALAHLADPCEAQSQ